MLSVAQQIHLFIQYMRHEEQWEEVMVVVLGRTGRYQVTDFANKATIGSNHITKEIQDSKYSLLEDT